MFTPKVAKNSASPPITYSWIVAFFMKPTVVAQHWLNFLYLWLINKGFSFSLRKSFNYWYLYCTGSYIILLYKLYLFNASPTQSNFQLPTIWDWQIRGYDRILIRRNLFNTYHRGLRLDIYYQLREIIGWYKIRNKIC